MIIVHPLVSCQLIADRLPEWCDTPCVDGICSVGPDPLPRSQDGLVLLENAGASESPGIVDTAGMTDSIIDDNK